MITDFKGVATNGKTIVAYGDYGIITTSYDYGKTWSQTTIGDKHSIKRIFNVGNDFIGVTDYSLFKSTDNAKTWQQSPEPFDTAQIIDASLSGSMLYILTQIGVWTVDMNLQISAKPILELDSTSTYTEIQADGTNFYVITDNVNITYFSVSSQDKRLTQVTAQLKPNVFERYLSDMKIQDSKIYLMLNDFNGFDYTQYLVQSTDTGKTWRHITPPLSDGNTYLIRESEISFLRANSHQSFSTSYFTVDSSHYDTDKSYFTVINSKDTIERMINTSGSEKYTQVAAINRDTIIAVGVNKLISLSYDGGKSWHLRSFFSADQLNQLGSGLENSSFIDENRSYIINVNSFFTTNDGGITWLPQKLNPNFPQINTKFPSRFFFNDAGKGYVWLQTSNSADSNVVTTNDYGNTYSKYYIDSLYPRFRYISPKGLHAGGIVLFAGNPLIVNGNIEKKAPYSQVLRYDEHLRFLDSVRIEANTIESMIAIPNGNIYALLLKTSGENKADSLGNSDTYSYSYFIMKSEDKGKTWDSVAISIPIRQELYYSSYYDTYLYDDVLSGRYAALQGDYILYPLTSGLIYRFNYKTVNFDSVQVPGKLNLNKNTIFTLDSTLYVISLTNDIVYYTYNKKFHLSPVKWDSLALSSIFTGWDSYDPSTSLTNKDVILSVDIFNDSTGIMLIGKTWQSNIGEQLFTINVVKLATGSTSTGISEPAITGGRIYLWNSPPYPLPGKNMIASRIYWDNDYDIANGTVAVYDISGMLLPEQKIIIDKQQDYKGLLQWDCSSVPNGVYIIKITLAGESLSFPVMVAR
jgi:photosystem II stability/assembly factor-like uncharacterized protein